MRIKICSLIERGCTLAWFRAWFRLVPLGSILPTMYYLQHFSLVPPWFSLVPAGCMLPTLQYLQHFRLVPLWFSLVPVGCTLPTL